MGGPALLKRLALTPVPPVREAADRAAARGQASCLPADVEGRVEPRRGRRVVDPGCEGGFSVTPAHGYRRRSR